MRKPMSRWVAAFIHLMISALVAGVLLATIYFVLYPPPLFKAMGGSELALLVIAVDVVIGPLLTLAVFKSGKRGLKLDLGIIASVQLVALIYGLSVVWLARPVFLVARADVAYVVSAAEIRNADLARGQEPFRTLPWFGIVRATLAAPQSDAERQRVLDLNFKEGRDIQQMPEYYRPWEENAKALLEKAEKLEDLHHRKPQYAAQIDAWLAKEGRQIASVRYLSLLTLHAELCLLLDTATGAYLGILDVDAS